MTSELEKFWRPNLGYIAATRYEANFTDRDRRLDTAVLLGAIHGDTGDGFMAPYDDRILASLQKLREAFHSVYDINRNGPSDLGDAFGRYPEDTYDGYGTRGRGNP